MTISERINKIIEAREISKINFAKILNVTPAYISKITNKGAVPSDRLIDDICEKCNVNEEWLRTGNGDMFIETDDDFLERIDRIMLDENEARKNMIKSLLYASDEEIQTVQKLIDYYYSLGGDSK